MRMLTELVGTFSEAWQELRIHRTRVLLSLIGVAVAVCALTTVVGISSIAEQAITQNNERNGGRPATLSMSVSMRDGSAPDTEAMTAVWQSSLNRYGVEYGSRTIWGESMVQFSDGVTRSQTMAVDQPYGEMRRMIIEQGNWFAPGDETRLAPAVVINDAFWQRLGSPALESNPTVELISGRSLTAVVIGVYSSPDWDSEPASYMLVDDYLDIMPAEMALQQRPNYEMWVPVEISDQLTAALTSDVQAQFGESANVHVGRNDAGMWGDDPMLSLKLAVGGIAMLVLLLGALGLVNIAMVTVKQRIREIGIRRSFGATAGRVFFAVMMESVVATVVAGAVGVMVAILIVKSPIVEDTIGQGMISDFPPFPAEAALIGIVSAATVGAIAGLLPALVAVRVKVIDAIRY